MSSPLLRCNGISKSFNDADGTITILDNVSLSLAQSETLAILGSSGSGHRLRHQPAQLSGGERQRVAIARALVNSPSVIMADEPTGNLDEKNSEHILSLIQEINRESSTAFIIVTHERL